MDRKSELLARRLEKAGIRASIKQGHVLTESELKNIRIQILPNPLRVIFCVLGVISAAASYWCFTHDLGGYGFAVSLLSLLMFLFGIYGARKTLSQITDSMNAADAAEILTHAVDGISSAVGSIFDGL